MDHPVESHLIPLPDGDRLAVHITAGHADPLICLPGGPLLSSQYLGDLAGLAGDHRLALLDPRGTGGSDIPVDRTAYRCDRLADDIEAVRRHLGLAATSLLAHSAGANIAYRYLERHPDRVGRMVLVTPSPMGVGVDVTLDERRAVLALRQDEPWQPAAVSALDAIAAGTASDDDWAALAPTAFGRWDVEERAYADRMDAERAPDAVAAFAAEGAFDPAAAHTALARPDVPVLVVAGEYDVGNPPAAMARLAALSPAVTFRCLPGAGHFPWRDDASAFRSTVGGWLSAQG